MQKGMPQDEAYKDLPDEKMPCFYLLNVGF